MIKNIKYILYLAVLSVILCFSKIAHAQDNAVTEDAFEAAFEDMLNDPADVEKTLRYAELAVELDNYEAAIPAYERILFFNPDLVDVMLELGVMYYNLESYDVARTYFERVKAHADAGDDNRAQAEDYLSRMGG